MIQPVAPFTDHQKILEDVNILQKHVVAVSDHLLPIFLQCLIVRGLHQLEVGRSIGIGQHIKDTIKVINGVFQSPYPGLKDPELPHRIICSQDLVFGRKGAVGADHQETVAFGLVYIGAKGLILFDVYQYILLVRSTAAMPIDLVRSQGLWILCGVEERAVIVGPGRTTRGGWDAFRKYLTRIQVLDVKGILSAA